MDKEQKEQLEARRAAAKAFMESIDNLCDSFKTPTDEMAKAKSQSASTPPPRPPRPAHPPLAPLVPLVPPPKITKAPHFSFADLEEAIADIEQFMQSQEHKPPEASE